MRVYNSQRAVDLRRDCCRDFDGDARSVFDLDESGALDWFLEGDILTDDGEAGGWADA